MQDSVENWDEDSVLLAASLVNINCPLLIPNSLIFEENSGEFCIQFMITGWCAASSQLVNLYLLYSYLYNVQHVLCNILPTYYRYLVSNTYNWSVICDVIKTDLLIRLYAHRFEK